MRIGFVGLGNMGAPIAANLLKAGHELCVHNRTPAKARPLVEQGAHAAASPEEAARGSDMVFTMLADDGAVESVVFERQGILGSLSRDAIHIAMSTISVALSQRLAAAHAEAGQHYLAAPVLGRPEAAAAAKLFILLAGDPRAAERARPVLAALGQRIFTFGERPENANLVKLSCNFLIANVIEALGEALALVAKGGIDRHAWLELLTETLFAAPVYKTYGGLVVEQKFSPAGFAARLGAKDVRLALAAGEALRVPLPIASLLRDRFLTLLANGKGDLDWSALALLAARDAGLEAPEQG